MSRKDDILSRIHKLEEKIEEYNGYISELEEEYKYILHSYERIRDEADTPERTYDMTRSGKWMGQREDDAEQLQQKIILATKNSQKDTAKLLSDIERIIARLEELIQECEDEIAELNAELESLSDDDENSAGYEGEGK